MNRRRIRPWAHLVTTVAMVLFGLGLEIGHKGTPPLVVFGALPSLILPHNPPSTDLNGIRDYRDRQL